jgi:two-component system, cell cycle sensor histidine kinase and response regulator CckA
VADETGQARLAALAEYSIDAVVLVDQDGVVQWASPATRDVLGYDVGALVGTRVRDLLSPEDLGEWHARVERVRGTPGVPMFGKYRCRHGDGSWRTVEGIVRNLLDEPRVGAMVVVFHDISEREAVEAAQRDRDARYRRLVTEAPDVIMETDEEGYLQFVNPAGLRLMGFAADQVINRRFTEFIREDYRPAIFDHYLRQIEQREPSSYIELPVLAADGREVWLGQNAWLTFEAGQYRGFQVVARDITDRMQLEEQLLQAQTMEAVGRLAGGIAHDFNNLLAAIRGNAELLLHLTARAPAVVTELEEIIRSSDRAASLTRQLLAFSRKQAVQAAPLDLNGVVAPAERLMRRLVGGNVELILHLAPSLPEVMADRVQVEQVLLSLVTNARDALSHGGRITMSTVNVVLVAGRAETDAHRPSARGVRVRGGGRQRPGHGRGDAGADLRAVLHDQGTRAGHRARPGRRLRADPADGRRDHRVEPPRAGHDIPDLPAGRPRDRADRGGIQVLNPGRSRTRMAGAAAGDTACASRWCSSRAPGERSGTG